MLPIPLLLSACLALGPSAAVADATRAWDFDLRAPGLYKVQIEHPIDALSGARVAYEISIGDETRTRDFDLIAGRPFIALIADVPSPRRMMARTLGCIRTVDPCMLDLNQLHQRDPIKSITVQ